MIGNPCSQHESLSLTIMLLRISQYKGKKTEQLERNEHNIALHLIAKSGTHPTVESTC